MVFYAHGETKTLSYKLGALAIELNSSKASVGRELSLSDDVLHHYIFIISLLRLTSHLRSILFLMGTGTPGTSRDDTVRMLMGRHLHCIFSAGISRSTCVQ